MINKKNTLEVEVLNNIRNITCLIKISKDLFCLY